MNNTTDTVENTNNDSTLKKAMNYFTEEVCGMLPSAKKLMEQKGFTNSSEVEERMRIVSDRFDELKQTKETLFQGSEEGRKFSASARNTFLGGIALVAATPLMPAALASAAVIGGIGITGVGAITYPAAKLHEISDNLGGDIVAEHVSGIDKRELNRELKDVTKEYKELSKIADHLGIDRTKFDNSETMKTRQVMLDGMKADADKVFKEYDQAISSKLKTTTDIDHDYEVEKAAQKSKVKLR